MWQKVSKFTGGRGRGEGARERVRHQTEGELGGARPGSALTKYS